MLECKHKWPMVVTNRGLLTHWCTLHQKSVNDDICSECQDREGESLKPPMPALAFPTRTKEEIAAVYSICKSCPLMDAVDKTCNKMHPEIHPVDVVAQHPNNHCPEKLW